MIVRLTAKNLVRFIKDHITFWGKLVAGRQQNNSKHDAAESHKYPNIQAQGTIKSVFDLHAQGNLIHCDSRTRTLGTKSPKNNREPCASGRNRHTDK
jgi:hypothetical protein